MSFISFLSNTYTFAKKGAFLNVLNFTKCLDALYCLVVCCFALTCLVLFCFVLSCLVVCLGQEIDFLIWSQWSST